ncbi:Gfo/Idh/MocA family protein [Halosimplex amylolyticum]|uniref:Gfo/Idh/MocA family protein n=1 Tax=Halosimplex amylolyticum TaxID=3396616 RepID=UPI003F54AF5B
MAADNSPLRACILGVGNIGTVHLQSAKTVDGVTVTSAADVRQSNRERAREFGVERTYRDYEELLQNEPVDVAIVALPPFLHREAAVTAIESGCHVFVEKPFARSVDEADEILQATADEGTSIGVDHTVRFLPNVRELADRYRSGVIGHVPKVSASLINNGPFDQPPVEAPLPDWQLDPEATGGGVLLDLGLHLFDVLEWLFGDLTVVHATMGRQLNLPFEDAATVLLTTGDGETTLHLHCGGYQWVDETDMNFRLRFEGVAGALDTDRFTPNNQYVHAARSATENVVRRALGRDPVYFGPTYYLRAHRQSLAAFIDALRRGDRPPVDGEQGRRTLELAEAAYDAADSDSRGERP